MDGIILLGASQHAKVIIDIIEHEGRYTIAGLLDDNRPQGETVLGYSILGREADLPRLRRELSLCGLIVAIGDNFVRMQATERIEQLCPDLPFVMAVHPAATIARDVAIGSGSVVMAGVTVNPCATIGRGCILNTQSSLDHDSQMHDFASLAPHAATGGQCVIGKCSAVCIGAVLAHGILVGEHSVIGAGATVLESIAPQVVAFGTPAKVVRHRRQGEKYL